jgi:hypothetical protein
LRLVILCVQRERNNLGDCSAVKFPYSLVRNGLTSFVEIRTLAKDYLKLQSISINYITFVVQSGKNNLVKVDEDL